jgi:phenylalanyl-tRNA synthetase beta chain
MGGLHSAISANTKDIILECAYFEPIGIRLTAQKHNLNSDSAHRFMRNVDFNLQHIAMLRVSDLIKEIIKET